MNIGNASMSSLTSMLGVLLQSTRKPQQIRPSLLGSELKTVRTCRIWMTNGLCPIICTFHHIYSRHMLPAYPRMQSAVLLIAYVHPLPREVPQLMEKLGHSIKDLQKWQAPSQNRLKIASVIHIHISTGDSEYYSDISNRSWEIESTWCSTATHKKIV